MYRCFPVLALLFVASPLAAAQDVRPAAVVVMTGEAVVHSVPDRAWLTIAAESRASSPREAQRRNAEAMAPVIDKLRAAGIPADAVRTVAYDLQQEWDFVNNRRVSRGYVARNAIEVRVDAVDRVGELLEIAVASGATSVSGIHIPQISELTIFCGAMVGACIGFLWYNAHPAEIFMGDVGSLALGGAIGTVAVLIKQELLLPFIGGIFVIEALSVILQVASYKTRKKRIFKMAPLHHHFELLGWSESKIIVRFWISSLVFALFALTTLKLR